jgi:O-antigen ligase
LKTAARISLTIAILTNFVDLIIYNPYNTAEGSGRTAGFYGDANLAAAAIGTLLLLSVDFSRQNLKSMLVVGVSVLAIIATQSRSGIIFSVLLSAIYIFLPKGRETFSMGARLSLAAGGLSLLVLVVVTTGRLLDFDASQAWRILSLLTLDVGDTSSEGRLFFAQDALIGFLDSPWTGLGLGGPGWKQYTPHNAYLMVALEYGIGGLVIYLIVILHAVGKAFRFGLRRASTVLLLIFQFAYYSFFSHTVQSNTVFAIFFAAVIVNATISEPIESDAEARAG